MLGLVDAIDALIELDPPGLRGPAAPRATRVELQARREAKRPRFLPAPLRRPVPRRGRVYEVRLSAVEGIARGRPPASRGSFALVGAAVLALTMGLVGQELLVDGAALPALAAAPSRAPLRVRGETAAALTPRVEPSPLPAERVAIAPRSLPLAAEPALQPSPRESFTAPGSTPAALPGSLPDTRDLLGLVETLADPQAEPGVRAAAAAALASSVDPACEHALDDTALSADPAGRVLALEALARRSALSIPARIAVDRALSDPDPSLRAAGARALVAVRGATSMLIPRLPREKDPVVVLAMLDTIGKTAGPEHVATLELYARRSPAAARALAAACERNGLPVPAR